MSYFSNIYKNKKVLLTGDTGFKGSWLAIWLKELGAEVFGYSLPPKSIKDNFVTTGLNSKIEHRDGDVRDFTAFLKYVSDIHPDIAFHLAAQPLVLDSYTDPRYTFETNVMGTVNFFEIIRLVPTIKAAINITSDKCYQNNEWLWGYRESDPMGGKDPYSASKGASEIITAAYKASFFSDNESAAIASARAGNVIGGGDWADYRIVPDFFRALSSGKPLSLRYPDATRPWQHVLEPLSGYLLLGARLLENGKSFSGGWNFGPRDINNYSVQKLVETLINVAGKGTFLVPKDAERKHEASFLKLDISKSNHLLGWSPVLDFVQTIRFVVDGYLCENIGDDLYRRRLQQIREYTNIGSKNGLKYLI
jgi:CDP-glucose 4,6-dehydratase